MIITLRGLAFIGSIVAGSVSCDAATVCRGSYIIGFEIEAGVASKVLGEPTNDPARMRVYSSKSTRGYYYQSNFGRPGQQTYTKIFSDTPMSTRDVVMNVMFVSLAEAAISQDTFAIALRSVSSDTVQVASNE